MSTLCQFWEMALGEAKSANATHTVWLALHSLHMVTAWSVYDKQKKPRAMQTEGAKARGRHRNRLDKQPVWSDIRNGQRRNVRAVSLCVHVPTHFLTFLTFMLAVLLLHERMRGSVLSSGISALLA